MKTNITKSRIASFLSNASKLDMYVHKRTSDDVLGTVVIKKSAAENKGKRLYAVSSKVIHSGCYTMAGLRKALVAMA